jgi:hypothetical protein
MRNLNLWEITMKKFLAILALSLLAATAAQASTKTRLCKLSDPSLSFTDHGADTNVYFPETGQNVNFYSNDTANFLGQGSDGFVTASQQDGCGNKVEYFYTGGTPSYYFQGTVHLNSNVANTGPKCVGSLDTTGAAYQVGYPFPHWPADTAWTFDRGETGGTSTDPQIIIIIWRTSGSAWPAYTTWAFNMNCRSDTSSD